MELHVIKGTGKEIVVLLDNEMRVVKPVYNYLKFQSQKDSAINTLKVNGSDLRTFWKFLYQNGYEYDKVIPNMIADFIDYLRKGDEDVLGLHKESVRTNKPLTMNKVILFLRFQYML